MINIILLQFLEVNNNPVLKINLSKYNNVIINNEYDRKINDIKLEISYRIKVTNTEKIAGKARLECLKLRLILYSDNSEIEFFENII